MNRRHFLRSASALTMFEALPKMRAQQPKTILFLGTRVSEPGKGLYACFLDSKGGNFTPVALAADIAMPTSLLLARNRQVIYAVSEVGNDGKTDGAISAFALDRTSGGLSPLNRVPSGGGGPTSMAQDATGKILLVGCFGSGRTNAFRLLPDGRLGDQTASIQDVGHGPHPRQSGPHVHCVIFSPDNRFVIAVDFGADIISVVRFDPAAGTLVPHEPAIVQAPVGSGPRQIVFDPGGTKAYLLSELAATVTVFAWSASKGVLTPLQTISCLPPEISENRSGAGLSMHPNGRFLYTTTRTDSSIQVFDIHPETGMLVLSQRLDAGGKLPWSCALNAEGTYLVATNTTSNAASVFRIDPANGHVQPFADIPGVPSAVSALFVTL